MKSKIDKWFCLLLLIWFLPQLICSETYEIAINPKPNTEIYKRIDSWLSRLSVLTGMDFHLEVMTFERAEIQMRQSLIDMDFGRTELVYSQNDPIIYVPTPVLQVPYMKFSRLDYVDDSMILLSTQGNKAIESYIARKEIQNTIYVSDADTALKMLVLGRGDYFLENINLKSIIDSNPDYSSIHMLEQPAFFEKYYLVVNERHKDLIPLLDKAIIFLNETGRTEDILARGELGEL